MTIQNFSLSSDGNTVKLELNDGLTTKTLIEFNEAGQMVGGAMFLGIGVRTHYTAGVDRISGDVYTNNNNYPIKVNINIRANTSHTIEFKINGVRTTYSNAVSNAMNVTISENILPGETYSLTYTGVSEVNWNEVE